MNSIVEYFKQSELALAAYANLIPGVDPVPALQDSSVGMSAAQAARFASTWTVIAPTFTDAVTGVSVTIFQNNLTGQKTLAIRGTQASGNDRTADGLLALGLPSNLNPQFTALKTQLDAWLADPAMLKDQNFTVSGHSLGGYLAVAVKQAYPQATDAYLFNAPGVGGPLGNLADALTSTLGLSGTPSSNIWNVRGSEGFPIISGLGYQLGTSISIQTEAADNPLNNHSIIGLTDALAVQSLYAQLVPGLTQDKLNALVDASSATMNLTLESALDALRVILLGPGTTQTVTDDRNAFYTNLYSLMGNPRYIALAGTAQMTVLAGLTASDMAAMAGNNDAQGLAARYALVALNPFALVGADYSAFDTGGALELYDPSTGTGVLTEQYLADRSAFLERKLWFSTEDKNPVDPNVVFDSNNHAFQNEPTYFEDVASGYKIAQGFSPATPYANIHRYYFGGDGNDTYAGGGVEDHLYGGAGDDALAGGDGNDYLEGGMGADTIQGDQGNDTLLGGAGADTLNGGDGTDLLLGGADNDTLDGGTGNDILKGGEGTDTYAFTGSYGTDIITDSDGSGTITVDGQTLNSATQQFESIYKNDTTGHTFVKLNGGNSLAILKENDPNRILVNDWSEARNLGIGLQGNAPTAPAATLAGDFKKKIDDHGTPDTRDDTYVMTDGNYTPDPNAPDGEANALDLISGTAGNDVIDGKGGDDALSGMAGDDYIEGGIGSDAIQGGSGKDTLNGGAGDDMIYGSSDDAINKPTDVNFTRPINTYTHPESTGFNWTAGYNTTFTNGVPDGYSDAPRNRLEGDQGNIIDGGAGNDFIAAGTGADYVHGGAANDRNYDPERRAA